MDLEFIRYSFRLRWLKGFIKRCFHMRIEIVHHQMDFFDMGVMLINKFLDKVRPIHFGPLLRDFGNSVAQLRVQKP